MTERTGHLGVFIAQHFALHGQGLALQGLRFGQFPLITQDVGIIDERQCQVGMLLPLEFPADAENLLEHGFGLGEPVLAAQDAG